MRPEMEESITMWPEPWRRNWGRKARVTAAAPKKLVSNWRRNSASETSSAKPAMAKPALLTIAWSWTCGDRRGQFGNLPGVGHIESEKLDAVENAGRAGGLFQLVAAVETAHSGQHAPAAPG